MTDEWRNMSEAERTAYYDDAAAKKDVETIKKLDNLNYEIVDETGNAQMNQLLQGQELGRPVASEEYDRKQIVLAFEKVKTLFDLVKQTNETRIQWKVQKANRISAAYTEASQILSAMVDRLQQSMNFLYTTLQQESDILSQGSQDIQSAVKLRNQQIQGWFNALRTLFKVNPAGKPH